MFVSKPNKKPVFSLAHDRVHHDVVQGSRYSRSLKLSSSCACFDHAVSSLVIAIFWLMTMISGRRTTTTTGRPFRLSNSTCRPGQFRCRNGRCIPGRWVCNHEQDCPFAEDEPPSCRESRSEKTTDDFFKIVHNLCPSLCFVIVLSVSRR